MLKRNCDDWLTTYLHYVDNTESPLSYHTWVGLSVIAGTLQRRVFIRRQDKEVIYPNQYIVLVGPPGRVRKGTAIAIGRGLLEEVGIPLAAERVTKEALVRFMKKNLATFPDPKTGIPQLHCSVTCIAEELAVLLGQKDVELLAFLTAWYDSRDDWSYDTKTQGKDELLGMCFNFLAATAPDWLPSILPIEAISGGWTSRCIFVVEYRARKIVSALTPPKGIKELQKKLLLDLEQIRAISGEMVLTTEAQGAYEEWYQHYREEEEQGRSPVGDPRLDGYVSRRATIAFKTAVAVSASRSNDLTITIKDWHRTIKLLEAVEKNMPRVFAGIGHSRLSSVTASIMHFIQARKTVRRSQVLQVFYADIDDYTMESVERMLVKMHAIECTYLREERDKEYQWNGVEL